MLIALASKQEVVFSGDSRDDVITYIDECIMIYFKLLVLASWQGFYGPIDPKINPHLRLDMTYPPANFDVD